ncbi:MAG: hypothetical protein BWX72_00658 [Firmicutes bacterium ADurb.Bin080]|nr:MAG: hypothetical protein BWX72_00658 [Firmicutes bacterium ADurb.Bin080]
MNSFKRWLSIKKHKNARLILLIGIIVFNLLLWLVSSLIAFLSSPGSYGNAVEALWRTGITWMLDPGFYDPDGNVVVKVLSITVIITSMISFSGGIIAYVANTFSSIVEKSEKGSGKLYIYDHILILNWNSKALELIADYLYDEDVTNVVVLSSCEKLEVEKLVKRKLYDMGKDKAGHLNVIVRQGDVFSKSDLSDVCIDKASSIIILSPSDDNREIDALDMSVIKNLMLVVNCESSKDPVIIVEAKKEETVELVKEKIAKNTNRIDRIIPIQPDEMMGRLIAQTIIYPEVNSAYQELFSFKGAEFYIAPEGSIGDYMKENNYSIPLFNRNGVMYILSDSEKNLQVKRPIPISDYRKVEVGEYQTYREKNIIVFGQNSKLKYIEDSIRLFEKDSNSKVNITLVGANDADTINKSVKDIKKIDSILILSDDNISKEDYDSDVLLTLLMIQDIAKLHHADIIIELLDPKNYDIAQNYNIRNTIISNKYVSRIMTQLSKSSKLYNLFIELLTYDDNEGEDATYELYSFDVIDFFKGKNPEPFNSASELINSCYFSSSGEYTVIGYVSKGITRIFKGDLDTPEEIAFSLEDKVLVVCK